MHFGENQLSRSLIGLSPLTTGHPPGFQPWWVRSSTTSYSRFNLPMARSLRFGSWARYSGRPIRTRFRYGFPTRVNLATHRKLAGSFFKRHAVTRCHKVHPTLPRLVGTRFQVLFHSAPAVLFTIPSRYYPLSVTREYLGLTGGPARFTRDFSGPVLLGCRTSKPLMFQLRGSYPLRRAFACPSPTSTVSDSPPWPADHESAIPQPRIRNPCRVSHAYGLASSGFARHYSRESRLFSLPAGTEMFHFPAFPPYCLCVQQ